MLIAVALAALATVALKLPVETIGTQFGGIPRDLPLPALPHFSLEKIQAVLPNAISFALLGAIESLLSAVVADGMTGRRHRSNCELVGQGVANIASGLFGGICVTGTVARTATNVRAGARSPVSGMVHALVLLLFILVAAPLASYIPLAVLAAVLAVVCWNMFERDAFLTLLKASRGDAAVLLATFGITLFRGLTEAIVVGFALGSVLFIHRMSQTTALETHVPLVAEDVPDETRASFTTKRPNRIRRWSSIEFPARSSLAPPRPLARCSSASVTRTATSSSISPPCRLSIPPAQRPSKALRIRPRSAVSAYISRGCRRG